MQFSVIIPTRDRPQFVGDAITSVLGQKDVRLELLVINDGSVPVRLPDDPRIRLLDTGGAGAVPARNLGIAAAAGDIIAFLDDDDTWTDPSFLGKAAGALDRGADFVFADGRLVHEDGQPPEVFERNADVKSLAHDNTILISTVCYRRQLHDVLGSFDEHLPYYWDWDWYLRVARSGAQLSRLTERVVDIRVHAQNMSGPDNTPARQANLDALQAKHGLSGIVLKSHRDFAAPL